MLDTLKTMVQDARLNSAKKKWTKSMQGVTYEDKVKLSFESTVELLCSEIGGRVAIAGDYAIQCLIQSHSRKVRRANILIRDKEVYKDIELVFEGCRRADEFKELFTRVDIIPYDEFVTNGGGAYRCYKEDKLEYEVLVNVARIGARFEQYSLDNNATIVTHRIDQLVRDKFVKIVDKYHTDIIRDFYDICMIAECHSFSIEHIKNQCILNCPEESDDTRTLEDMHRDVRNSWDLLSGEVSDDDFNTRDYLLELFDKIYKEIYHGSRKLWDHEFSRFK